MCNFNSDFQSEIQKTNGWTTISNKAELNQKVADIGAALLATADENIVILPAAQKDHNVSDTLKDLFKERQESRLRGDWQQCKTLTREIRNKSVKTSLTISSKTWKRNFGSISRKRNGASSPIIQKWQLTTDTLRTQKKKRIE